MRWQVTRGFEGGIYQMAERKHCPFWSHTLHDCIDNQWDVFGCPFIKTCFCVVLHWARFLYKSCKPNFAVFHLTVFFILKISIGGGFTCVLVGVRVQQYFRVVNVQWKSTDLVFGFFFSVFTFLLGAIVGDFPLSVELLIASSATPNWGWLGRSGMFPSSRTDTGSCRVWPGWSWGYIWCRCGEREG